MVVCTGGTPFFLTASGSAASLRRLFQCSATCWGFRTSCKIAAGAESSLNWCSGPEFVPSCGPLERPGRSSRTPRSQSRTICVCWRFRCSYSAYWIRKDWVFSCPIVPRHLRRFGHRILVRIRFLGVLGRPMSWRQFRCLRVMTSTAVVATAGLPSVRLYHCRVEFSAPVLLQRSPLRELMFSHTCSADALHVCPGASVKANQGTGAASTMQLHRTSRPPAPANCVWPIAILGLQAAAKRRKPEAVCSARISKSARPDGRRYELHLGQRPNDEKFERRSLDLWSANRVFPFSRRKLLVSHLLRQTRIVGWAGMGTPLETEEQGIATWSAGTLVLLVGGPGFARG